MSRKARMPILLPKGVQATLQGEEFSVKGPKGALSRSLTREVLLTIEGEQLHVQLKPEYADARDKLGLFWALISNMVKGVSVGFEKRLEMVGVGYRAAVQGNNLSLQIGFSHPTLLPIPTGVQVVVEKNTSICMTGIDNQKLGQFAADIRGKRPPEPYKGKGIRYHGEYVRSKAGKSGKAGKK